LQAGVPSVPGGQEQATNSKSSLLDRDTGGDGERRWPTRKGKFTACPNRQICPGASLCWLHIGLPNSLPRSGDHYVVVGRDVTQIDFLIGKNNNGPFFDVDHHLYPFGGRSRLPTVLSDWSKALHAIYSERMGQHAPLDDCHPFLWTHTAWPSLASSGRRTSQRRAKGTKSCDTARGACRRSSSLPYPVGSAGTKDPSAFEVVLRCTAICSITSTARRTFLVQES